MELLSHLTFITLLIFGFGLFIRNINKIIRNIKLGKKINRNDQPSKRWKTMFLIAFGQGKMMRRPIAGLLHLMVYIGFIIVNIEMFEILVDGIFGTHRYLWSTLGGKFYDIFIFCIEFFALLVAISVIIFFIRRNVIKIPRLSSIDLVGWAKKDANIILIIEFLIIMAFFAMNSAEYYLRIKEKQEIVGFSISKNIFPFFNNYSVFTLYTIERAAWWFHFIAILFFLNYLYYSKHLHILFAFPNTWYSKLSPEGELDNLSSVTHEIKLMLDPNADPFSNQNQDNSNVEKFGASDIFDLNRVQLLNAYTCTECGRCSSDCPANITGKKLSPRAIMMKIRDRTEEVGRNIDKNGKYVDDGKQLLNDYIKPEELWACTTCNACVKACPVLIDPLSVIIDMRRYLVMEKSEAPSELNIMMTNIENNGAPWQFNQNDRDNWTKEK